MEKRSSLSLETFICDYFLMNSPVIIGGCIDHWPARTKWKDLEYLKKIAGDRTVPVEVIKFSLSGAISFLGKLNSTYFGNRSLLLVFYRLIIINLCSGSCCINKTSCGVQSVCCYLISYLQYCRADICNFCRHLFILEGLLWLLVWVPQWFDGLAWEQQNEHMHAYVCMHAHKW